MISRRKAVKNTVLAGVGTVLLPQILNSCNKFPKLKKGDFNGDVIIIGAGAAGLYAGHLLKSLDINFTILEASPVIGGRMGKLIGFADYPLDLGAQWLHGKNNLLGKLIRKTKTKITYDNTDIYFWFENKIEANLPDEVEAIFSGKNLPDISFLQHAQNKGFGENYRYIVENLAGDQGAAASNLSVYWNHKEEEDWNSGDKDYKFEQTYYDLIANHVAHNIADKILVNTQVKSIDYSNTKINLQDQNGTTYVADKVIISVPISVLKDGDISFIPALPEEKTSAFQKIGMGPGMKVFLKFSEKFFHDNISGGQVCAAYASEHVGKSGNDHLLLAFIMGDQAAALTVQSDAQIVQALLNELEIFYPGKAQSTFLDAYVQDWTKHPFIRGAYGYSTIGMGNARSIAQQKVDNKLFFAGEAMQLNANHQTAHGAVESGYYAVAEMLEA
ncbi:MAG: hypothetical protein RL264_867 [Bacteroidota bacterium]|jgi:lysine-specific histone demethylase 1B